MERNEKGYPVTPAEDCAREEASTLVDKPLAYAYVPVQRWRMLYSDKDALGKGTLFEELYKPMKVYGNE